MSLAITVDHEGVEYHGNIMLIERTSLGREDHGIFTAQLHCAGAGTGIGVGGYSLDTPDPDSKSPWNRIGTAFGLDHIIRIMETVGVDEWEQLRGKRIIVLFDKEATWGPVVGIADLSGERVLLFHEHVKSWREKVPA